MKSRSYGQDDTGQQGGVYMTGGHVDLYIIAEQSERADQEQVWAAHHLAAASSKSAEVCAPAPSAYGSSSPKASLRL